MIHGPGSSSKKNIALKAKKSSKKIVSSSEEFEDSSSSDEESNSSDELALFVKRFNKKFGNKLKHQGESSSSKHRKSTHRKKSDMAKRACFNCGKKGHFIAECPEKADEDKEKKGFKKHPHKKSHDRHKKKDWNKDSAHKKKSEDGIAGLAVAISSATEKISPFDSADSLSEDAFGDDRNSASCFMAKSSKVSFHSEVEVNSSDKDETDNEGSELMTYERLQFIVEKQEDLLITEIKKNTNMPNELKRLKSKFQAMEELIRI
ncbi:uncharacterized protein LOC106865508 [Brachypodium distachyon]|uniref:uncharacterized protein LOC106865508 n=1 Tax=Brachypodium distachyon TaxID=15368 RepID=UPI00071CE8E0|nr:uncharacterized protein LOC106865508 [Brachypodium distachyon]|eukprot:XP_014751135.1 uncharacterized protein LOC106865508 [Brachypodium distachyon]